MSKSVIGRYVTAIDIGTTKICVLIADTNGREGLEIVGVGQHPSHGLKKGVVVNVTKTAESIRAAVEQAQSMAGVTVEHATVGISGGNIKSYNSTGVVAIKGRDVSQYDINRVIDAAKAIPLSQEQEILHILPQYFRVDGQEYVIDSLGMYGVRLEAQVHIITGAVASAQNIIKSCELANISVTDIVLEQLASAEAVLTPSEREVGAAIIDIGGGTSDFAIYKDGRIRHSKVLPIAGTHFTNDIAIGLGVPLQEAEMLKRRFGILGPDNQELKGLVDIDLGYEGGKKAVDLRLSGEILRSRAEEIFELFSDEILEYRLSRFMPSGLVLTGGGSLLAGIKNVAQDIIKGPVRIGYPLAHDGFQGDMPDVLKSPIYATAYGLLLYATGEHSAGMMNNIKEAPLLKVFRRMKSWIYDFL